MSFHRDPSVGSTTRLRHLSPTSYDCGSAAKRHPQRSEPLRNLADADLIFGGDGALLRDPKSNLEVCRSTLPNSTGLRISSEPRRRGIAAVYSLHHTAWPRAILFSNAAISQCRETTPINRSGGLRCQSAGGNGLPFAVMRAAARPKKQNPHRVR